jgi:hypothetical protein
MKIVALDLPPSADDVVKPLLTQFLSAIVPAHSWQSQTLTNGASFQKNASTLLAACIAAFTFSLWSAVTYSVPL